MINWLTQENLDILRQMTSPAKYCEYVENLTAVDLTSDSLKAFLGYNQELLRNNYKQDVSVVHAYDALVSIKLHLYDEEAIATFGSYIIDQLNARGLVLDLNPLLGISSSKGSANLSNAPEPVNGRVVFPYSTLTVDSNIYAKRTDITSVKIGDLTTSIGRNAFRHCSNLKSVEFNGYLTHIDAQAFAYTELEDVSLPSSLRRIGDGAFGYIQSLKKIHFEEGLEHIDDNAFFSCAGVSSIELPTTVTMLGDSAFALCSSLDDIKLPAVEVIGDRCFCMCRSLTTLKLPDSLTKLGDSFAEGCSSLEDLWLPTSIDNVSAKSFDGLPKGCKIHIKGDYTGSSPLVMYLYNRGYKYEVY